MNGSSFSSLHSSGDEIDRQSSSPPPLGRSTGTAAILESSHNHTRSRSIQFSKSVNLAAKDSTESLGNHIEMISPRSSNYERLEGGMGPSRMGNKYRFGWKKIAIAAAVIIGLVWFFSPSETTKIPWQSENAEEDSESISVCTFVDSNAYSRNLFDAGSRHRPGRSAQTTSATSS